MAGAGALIATSSLPSWAEPLTQAMPHPTGVRTGEGNGWAGGRPEDDPAVFPKRGQYERLSLSYATVEIGLGEPFSVLHISDSHLTAAYDNENEKKLKLREYIGFKMLYGHLSDRNNPFVKTDDNELFVFPTRDRHQTTFVMDDTPYMELSVGISNIFKVLTVQYVRRLNYNNMPDIYGGDKLKKNGIRFAVDFKF